MNCEYKNTKLVYKLHLDFGFKKKIYILNLNLNVKPY